MESNRLQKVSRLIQKDMGEILRLESKSLFGGSMLTVTKVSVSADLSFARIFVSIFPIGQISKEEILNLLKQHKKYLRNALATQIRHQLRVIPDLAFFLDDSLDYADNIEQLLRQ